MRSMIWPTSPAGMSYSIVVGHSDTIHGRSRSPGAFWRSALRGGYPEIAAHPRRDVGLWLASYVQTYLERDVRALRQVGDLGQFQVFLRGVAARSVFVETVRGIVAVEATATATPAPS